MRRLAWVVVASVVALGIGAAPAAADNGPHVQGAGVLTDSCASCHRVHTAKTDMMTTEAQPALCYTCHGASGTGAATDVEDGVSRDGAPGTALRGGGFRYALIDSANPRNPRQFGQTSIGVRSTRADVTSSHSVNGASVTALGGGSPSPTPNLGPSIQLRCSSCHDPHGNGNYRLLRPVPTESGAVGPGIAIPETPGASKVYTTTNYWAATDSNEPNFISNVAAWCSTCHTRYLADDEANIRDSTDAVFAFRHWSDTKAAGRPNCIQCHVAHGTNALDPTTQPPPHVPGELLDDVAHPDQSKGGTVLEGAGSSLLRVDKRGTCVMCHN